MKMWRWSKAAMSLIWSEPSMPLPKTSPDMSPMPTAVKGSVMGIDPKLDEVTLERLPGTPRGDPELLVVVAGRTPEAKASSSQNPYSAAIELARSLKVAVPRSAATTR